MPPRRHGPTRGQRRKLGPPGPSPHQRACPEQPTMAARSFQTAEPSLARPSIQTRLEDLDPVRCHPWHRGARRRSARLWHAGRRSLATCVHCVRARSSHAPTRLFTCRLVPPAAGSHCRALRCGECLPRAPPNIRRFRLKALLFALPGRGLCEFQMVSNAENHDGASKPKLL